VDAGKTTLLVEAAFAVVLFVAILLAFRRMRAIAVELERRKSLSEYVRGLDLFLRGDYREARATLEAVLERDPENVEARIALGDCCRELDDPAEAKKHHHHVHKVFGHELARNFLSLGRDELALRNYDRAAEAFRQALAADPHDRDARAGLAQAYADGGSPVEAARELRLLYPRGPAPDLPPRERRAAANRLADAGQALLADGDAEGAVKLFTEALAFQPQSIRARTGLVRAAHQLGDGERARRLVEEHVAELRRLAAEEEVLFEPAAPRPARPDLGEREGAESGPVSLLPARVEEMGAVVTEVEQKTARYTCRHCGVLLREYAEQCPACGAVGRVEALPELASLYLMPVADFEEAVSEVEESAAFVQKLARDASLGDDEALRRLLARGAGGLYDVFAVLPALEARRGLGARMAQLGAGIAADVRQCHAARGGGGLGAGALPHDDFAAAFYLALPDADADVFLASLGEARDAAVAGVMCDPRVPDSVRDAALRHLQRRGVAAAVPVVEAVAASGDFGGVERAAALVRAGGNEAVELLERRFFQGTLLGRLLRKRKGARRRATADILARTGLPAAREALARAAAREKDEALRAHYVAAKERAEKGGPA